MSQNKEYERPVLELYKYRVESGFAESPKNLVMDVSDSLEDVIEGQNYGTFNEDTWY